MQIVDFKSNQVSESEKQFLDNAIEELKSNSGRLYAVLMMDENGDTVFYYKQNALVYQMAGLLEAAKHSVLQEMFQNDA